MHEKALEGYISRGMKALAEAVFGNQTEETCERQARKPAPDKEPLVAGDSSRE
jgi:hypothetical protein